MTSETKPLMATQVTPAARALPMRVRAVPYIISAQLASEREISTPKFVEGVIGALIHVGLWFAANIIDIVLLASHFNNPATTLHFLQVLSTVTVLIATAVVAFVIFAHWCLGGVRDGLLAGVVSGAITAFARLSSWFSIILLLFILFKDAIVVEDYLRNLVAIQVVLKHFGVTLMLHNHRFKAHDDATSYTAAQ